MVILRRVESCPELASETRPLREAGSVQQHAGASKQEGARAAPAWLDQVPVVVQHGFCNPAKSAALRFNALDLAMPVEPPLAPAQKMPHQAQNAFLNMDDLKKEECTAGQHAAFTQKAFYARTTDNTLYRLKLNQRPTTSLHEFIVPRLLAALGFDAAMPQTRLVSDQATPQASGDVWIASPVVDGYRDLACFLLEDGISYVPPMHRQAYQELKTRCEEARAQTDQIRNGAEVKQLLSRLPKGNFSALTHEQHALLQPLRDLSRHALVCQYKMFALLPQTFGRELKRAYYMAEIINNWDFMNHGLSNFGYAVQNGKIRACSVDGGNSGPVGFGGKLKTESGLQANQPACIDDPFALTPGPANPHAYLHNQLPANVRLDHVSTTYAQTGSLPRSMAFSPFVQEIIRNERARHEVDVKFDAPREAMEVAWRLKHIPPGRIQDLLQALFDQGLAHADPAIRRLFTPEITRFDSPQALANIYQSRMEAIVARAEHGGHLQRWVVANPLQALALRFNITRSERAFKHVGVTPAAP